MSTAIVADRSITLDKIIEMFQRDDVYYETKNSDISKFYAGKSVFLTGGTGFLGKLLIEKLLRACPDINCIFMLARAKKGKDPHTRIDELFNDVLFDKLSQIQPKFRHKIVLINGDVALPGMGLTIEDRKQITEKATIFIHSAATVKFTERLSSAVDINIKGTKEVITLARECQHLDSFVHVSTVFSHCATQPVVAEEVYDVPFDDEKIIQICNATPPALLEKITPELLGAWPNTYVFTKAIAENCVKKYAAHLPACIVRPAVVIGTYKEPLKAWINNVYGATGIVVGAGVGILRAANINQDSVSEIVPGDMVINAIIAATYKTATEKTARVPVYNYVASLQNPIKWKDFMKLNEYYGSQSPSERGLWIYSLKLIQNPILYQIYAFLVHIIPGFLMDTGLLLLGKKPQMLTAYRKIHSFNDTIKYFANRNWKFTNDNTQKLYESLSEEDKKLFFFDMSKLNWVHYFAVHCLGLRTYLVKDPLTTIPRGKSKYFKFQIAHYLIKFLFFSTLFRIVYAFFSYIFNYL